MSDTSNSYEIKDLDVKSVSTAINNCLVLLSDEELDSMSSFLSSESNDIKPDFLKITPSDIESTLIMGRIWQSSKSSKKVPMDFNQAFYKEAKTTMSNGFSSLRSVIEKINNSIITWNNILNENTEIDKELEEIQAPEDDLPPTESKITVENDLVGVTDTGSKVNIPAGEYDYGEIKTVNGKTYMKIVINGVEYWVLFKDGVIVSYIASLIDTNVYVGAAIVGLTLLGTAINIPPGDYKIHDAKDIDGKTYIQIEVNGETVWVLFEDGKIVPYADSSNITPVVIVTSTIVGITENGEKVTIPSGTYEILGTKTIDGKTYVKISINGVEYWVLYENGVIVPYKETPGEEREPYNGEFNDISITIYVDGNPINLKSGEYTIISTFDSNGQTYAVILYKGKYYIVLLDENGNIVDGSDATLVKGVYTILNTDITINIDGEKINIKAGKYQIIAIMEINGKRYGLILIDGKYYWVLIDENNNIIPNSEGDPVIKPSVIVTEPITIIVNGEPVTITPGSYVILNIKTIDGKRYVLLLINGVYYWVLVDDNNNIVPNGEGFKANSIVIVIDNDLVVIVDGEPVKITPGTYTILDVQIINGRKYGLILINGKYYWVPLDENDNIVPNGEAIPFEKMTFDWDRELIFIINGEKIIVKPGTYTILRVIHYDDGSYAYYVLIDGKYYWFHFDKDGNFKYAYIEIPGNGVYTIDTELEIIDELGHVVGMTDQTTYHIYSIIYDADGNIIAIRISPPGEPERWIYVRSKGKTDGTYIPTEEDPSKSSDSVKYSHFKDHKLVLGCLLGLASVIGGAIVYKKKKNSKEKLEEYELEDGEYPVFEEDFDDDGSISLRINNDSSEDDYWMEVR